MIKLFLDNVQTSANLSIEGMEGLGVGERVGLFFKEISLNYDKMFANFKSSAHVVDYDKTAGIINDRQPNYFKNVNSDITIPAFFSAKAITWDEYCRNVGLAAPLLSTMITETSRFYSWLKDLARTGKAGRSFRFTISSTNTLLFNVEAFVGSLSEHRSAKGRFGELYPSFGEVFNTIQRYNSEVSAVKNRDVEVLAKSLNQISAIGDLIAEKIKSSDLVLNESDLEALQRHFKDFVKYANYTGVMLGLMNEQTAVFKEQLEDLKKMK